MKRLIAFILCMIMTLSVIPFAASADGFDDVSEGKWYTEGISFCVANGYMAGVSPSQFDRSGTLTRAMFVTILAQVDWADTDSYADEQIFTDVKPGKWYSGAVNWAYTNGLASGLGDGTFGYKNPVTREQMAVFLYAYISYAIESGLHVDLDYINEVPDMHLDIISRADLSKFDDASRLHSWGEDAMSWAVAVGLFSGTSETTLDPRGNCTRAQAAVLIYALHRDVIYAWCEHEWIEGSCSTPAYCNNCDLTGGFKDHTYNANGECTVCGAEYDADLNCGHVWVEPGCDYDSFCWKCFVSIEGTATGHNLVVNETGKFYHCSNTPGGYECYYVSCVDEHVPVIATAPCCGPEYCGVCYSVLNDPIPHEFNDDGVCFTCGGKYDAEYDCVHVFTDPTCVEYGYCINCGKNEIKPSGHDYDIVGYCKNCGYANIPDQGDQPECQHSLSRPICMENVCSICGETVPPVDHNYDESGHCIYCGNIKPCEEHSWIPATCKERGYCSVCFISNPDEPAPLGHSHDPETKLCVRCNLYRDWTLSNYDHIKKNIQINGIELPDGSLAITDENRDGSIYIFMRPNNDNNFFVQYLYNGNVTDFWKIYTGRIELKFDPSTNEVEFDMEINRDGVFMFSANGNFDKSRDENFGGQDYSNCTTVEDVWNESEATEEDIYDIIYHFLAQTMMKAETTASRKLDTNLDNH